MLQNWVKADPETTPLVTGDQWRVKLDCSEIYAENYGTEPFVFAMEIARQFEIEKLNDAYARKCSITKNEYYFDENGRYIVVIYFKVDTNPIPTAALVIGILLAAALAAFALRPGLIAFEKLADATVKIAETVKHLGDFVADPGNLLIVAGAVVVVLFVFGYVMKGRKIPLVT